MKYWGYLLAKLVVAGLFLSAVWYGVRAVLPKHAVYLYSQTDPFGHDLGYTAVMMLYFLLCAGALAVIVWDQRYRCRTCLRRLRMPVAAGSWPNMLMLGQPRTEYICLYGHGTLKVPEVQINGPNPPDWEPHDEDIWKELESLEESKK
jgi:hypothetical protein